MPSSAQVRQQRQQQQQRRAQQAQSRRGREPAVVLGSRPRKRTTPGGASVAVSAEMLHSSRSNLAVVSLFLLVTVGKQQSGGCWAAVGFSLPVMPFDIPLPSLHIICVEKSFPENLSPIVGRHA